MENRDKGSHKRWILLYVFPLKLSWIWGKRVITLFDLLAAIFSLLNFSSDGNYGLFVLNVLMVSIFVLGILRLACSRKSSFFRIYLIGRSIFFAWLFFSTLFLIIKLSLTKDHIVANFTTESGLNPSPGAVSSLLTPVFAVSQCSQRNQRCSP